MKLLVVAVILSLAVIGATRWLADGAETMKWSIDAATISSATVTTDRIGDQNQTLPRGQLPVFAADADTKALYKFAVENKDTLAYMPCTCGCGDAQIGHTSNRSCYIKDEKASRVTFTSHAAT